MKKTYKTDHPTIKEISIGDQFVTYDGKIVTFIDVSVSTKYPFVMITSGNFFIPFNINLSAFHVEKIKHKYIPLKDKINLL